MRVLGIDLAADPKTTGVVIIEPAAPLLWRAVVLDGSATDDALVHAAQEVDVIGVDSPLGWPIAFTRAMEAHSALRPWPWPTDRETLTRRDTDRDVRQRGLGIPLSVSADRLGSVAMRCALLQQRWGTEVWRKPAPRDGSGPLVETYPAAAFRAWKIQCAKYKDRVDPAHAATVRAQIVADIQSQLGDWLDLKNVTERCVASDHVLDGLMCALVAIAAKTDATNRAPESSVQTALVEGWIHTPSRPLATITPALRTNASDPADQL